MGEARPAKPVKSTQWIDLSAERREPKRAAGGAEKAPIPYGWIKRATVIPDRPFTELRQSLKVGTEVPTRKFPMPKLPDMSASAVKSREALTKIYKASKPKEAPAAPPKPRVAKGR